MSTTKDFTKLDSYQTSKIILLGAPWEVTVNIDGTVNGPESIKKLSTELDAFDPKNKRNPRMDGMHFHILNSLKQKNDELRPLAEKVIFEQDTSHLKTINEGCQWMVETLAKETKKILDDNKGFGLLGGDHSVSEGSVLEVSKQYKNDVGLLHFDAHADMYDAYQGFKHSHASVIRNIVQNTHSPKQIIQVGIRDICEAEYEFIQSHSHIHCFFDHQLKSALFDGKSWMEVIQPIIEKLPDNIYISLDVDVMTWTYAPHTGYPVPGGLTYDQIDFLISQIVNSGKKIIGFDVNEVARPSKDPFNEWNAVVGTRLVYKLCNAMNLSKA